MRAADNIYARRRAMSPRFAHLAPAAGESWEKSGGVLAAEKRNSDIFTQQAQSGTRGGGVRCTAGYNRGAVMPTGVQPSASGLRFHHPGRTAGTSIGDTTREMVFGKPYCDMSSDVDRRVRCDRPEWAPVAGSGLPPSCGVDAFQYATLLPTAFTSSAVDACQDYRNDHFDGLGYLQRPGKVPSCLLSEGGADNLVSAYNTSAGREIRSARRGSVPSAARAQPEAPIGYGSDGDVLPPMGRQHEEPLFGRRRTPATEVPRAGESMDRTNARERHQGITRDKYTNERGNRSTLPSKGPHLSAVEMTYNGDHDKHRLHPIPSAFQLNGQQAAPANMGGDGTVDFGGTHQQQHSLRYHYQRCQVAAQDRSKDEFSAITRRNLDGHAADEDDGMFSQVENISPSAGDLRMNSGRRYSTSPVRTNTYSSVPVQIERNTTAPSPTFGMRAFDATLVNPNTPLHLGPASEGHYQGQYQRCPRDCLPAEPQESTETWSFARGHSTRNDHSSTHRFHGDHIEACGTRRWSGAGSTTVSGSGGTSDCDSGDGGGGNYQATGHSTYMKLSLSERVKSSFATSYGSIRNVARRPAQQHRPRQANHQRSGFRFNGEAGISAYSRGTPTTNLVESPSRFAATSANAASLSPPPPDNRSRKSVVAPSELTMNDERHPTPDIAPHNAHAVSCDGNGMGSALGSSRAPTELIQSPENRFGRLESFQVLQAVCGDKYPTTPRSSRSSSASSLSSLTRFASLRNASDVGVFDQRADVEKMRHQTCPAPDCPGNGDCVPSAKADTVAYEVAFKRGKMTFLSGDGLGNADISCGDRVKVEADRGEDLGTVHRSLPLSEYLDALYEEKKAKAAKIAQNGGGGSGDGGGSEGKKKRNKAKKHAADGDKNSTASRQQQQKKQQQQEAAREEACPVRTIKKILRPATLEELEQLQQKAIEEDQILHVCQTKVRNRGLPMKIVDAEYQFDRHKLTLFFEAERRVDFRELVRDLFAVYKTRIWMQQVKDKTKRAGLPETTAADSDPSPSVPGTNPVGDNPGGDQLLSVPPRTEAAIISAHDADHDSGYGSTGSSGSGRPEVESLLPTGVGDISISKEGSYSLWDGLGGACYGRIDSSRSGGTACTSSMSWLDEIESEGCGSSGGSGSGSGGSGNVSTHSKRSFATQYPVLLQGIDFSF